jgi:phosphoribosyl 1,2-cyclic phosphate phosphodiesterase
MVIPKPLCHCAICRQAREKGPPYERTGPSAFLHDLNLLIDTPAEISQQLNRARIAQCDRLTFTHLDPDHTEGFRVVEQIALDFRSWRAYKEKQVTLILPERLRMRLADLGSVYGPLIDFYEKQEFIKCITFRDQIRLGPVRMTALAVNRREVESFVYVFEGDGKRLVYAPCDIRPFPEEREEVQQADLLVIQPGIFERGLKHGFQYPEDHVSRTTLYTFEQTMALARRIRAREILFVHLEEYWNRSHEDYMALEEEWEGVRFAHDGMRVTI